MALNNYSNLKDSIIAWSKRPDLAIRVDDYIDIAESEMYSNMVAPLRVRSMETRSTSTTGTTDRFHALPDGFLEMRRLSVINSSGISDIVYMAPEQLQYKGTSGQPRWFTVTSQIEFDVIPDSAYTLEISFLAADTPLDDTNTTNTILTDSPTIYLYGALWALFQDAIEPDLAEYYYGKFIGSIQGANKRDTRGRYGPAPKIRIEGATP